MKLPRIVIKSWEKQEEDPENGMSDKRKWDMKEKKRTGVRGGSHWENKATGITNCENNATAIINCENKATGNKLRK